MGYVGCGKAMLSWVGAMVIGVFWGGGRWHWDMCQGLWCEKGEAWCEDEV